MKLADYLTRDDLAEVEDVAGKLDALLTKHRQHGSVPLDELRFLDYRLNRLVGIQRSLPIEASECPHIATGEQNP